MKDVPHHDHISGWQWILEEVVGLESQPIESP